MRKRITGLLAIAALVVSACSGSAATPTPAPTPVPTAAPVATVAPSAVPSQASGPDLTATNYKPEAVGKTGGKLVLGEYQEPVTAWYGQFDTSATDVEAFGISLWGLWNATADYKWYGQLASKSAAAGLPLDWPNRFFRKSARTKNEPSDNSSPDKPAPVTPQA